MAQLNISVSDHDLSRVKQAAYNAGKPVSLWVREKCLGVPDDGTQEGSQIIELRLWTEKELEGLDSRLTHLEELANG